MRWRRRSDAHLTLKASRTSTAFLVPLGAAPASSVDVEALQFSLRLHLWANLPELDFLCGTSAALMRWHLTGKHRGRGLPRGADPAAELVTAALHTAAGAGAVPLLRQLLHDGAGVNSCVRVPVGDRWTPLHRAAQTCSTEAVALLLEHGADVLAVNEAGATALHIAAFHGRLANTKLLVLRGANVHAKDKGGFTPLDDAKYNSPGCPCALDEKAAEERRQWGSVAAFLQRLSPMPPTERRAFTRRSWELWVSPVLQDAAWEHTHLAQLSSHLECFGGYVNARDHDGSAALHAAAESGHAEAVDSLLRAQVG